MYLGGLVHSAGYPTTTGAVQLNFGGGSNTIGNQYACDMSISKISSLGNSMIWSTYLGGSSNETPHSLYVDNAGNLLIYGRTYSNNFPTTAGAYDQSANGGADITVSKINAAGNGLLGSTYVGGTGSDGVNYDPTEPGQGNLKVNYGDDARGEIIADNNNDVYVATCTKSSNFPAVSAFQPAIGGGQDGCVFKLSSDLSTMIWSSFIGGTDDDACYSLDVFNTEVYTSGGTMSADFPATSGSLHASYLGGTSDGFVAHISSSGSSLLQSTFIGTAGNDQVYFVKLDKTSNVYFFGQTTGSYPIFSVTYSNPNSGQFIHKIDPLLSTSIYSTVIGNGNGAPNISPTAFLVDTCENIYISGWGGTVFSGWPQFTMNMLNMPLTPNAFQSSTDGNDFYLAVYKKNMSQLMYATYFGGYGTPGSDLGTEHVDGGTSRFDKNGYVYQAICAGCGGTSLTPTTTGVWSETNGCSFNCNELGFKMEINLFIVTAALEAYPTATGCVPLTVGFTNNSINATQYLWDFGDGGTSTAVSPTYTFTDTGTFQVMLIATDPTACVPIDTAYTTVVVYNTTVTADFTTVVTDFCDSLLVDFSAITSGTATSYEWDFGDGETANGANVSHVYTEPGLYTVTLVVNDPLSCNKLDTITQEVDYTHVLIAEVSNSAYFGCPPLTIDFSNTGYGGVTFSWVFGDGQTSSDPAPSHTYQSPGTYSGMLVIYDPSSCNETDTAFFTVTVFPYPPNAAFTANPTVIQDYVSDVTFTNQSTGALYYYWDFGDGDTSSEVNPIHTYLLSGDYLACLTAMNDGGCPDQACVLIKVELIPVVDVPNAFSPNGDGANDILYVKGQDVKTVNFKLFNRWGELVFETNDINKGWNGIYKGEEQEMEVYVWTLSATFSDGKAAVRSGNVTLLR
jgi:gliding motility-associated-like protein